MCPQMRGRRRGRRWVDQLPPSELYYPRLTSGQPTGVGRITVEELEVLRLVDLMGLSQEDAAASMGVSRKTLWRDLTSARRKLVESLINGWAIEISGGDYVVRGAERTDR
ncbi:MAG: DUF134 domain-containing protein [Thermoplasmata archaeon]|nr:DUF134 domain-containing protein [Thermoplasmata archaeon]